MAKVVRRRQHGFVPQRVINKREAAVTGEGARYILRTQAKGQGRRFLSDSWRTNSGVQDVSWRRKGPDETQRERAEARSFVS
jgi:hypothetical protein